MPGCQALEYAILDIKLHSHWWRPYVNNGSPKPDTVCRLLASLPRLFYVLVWEGQWDLTTLPSGWEAHVAPEEAAPGERPLILEPKGIFSGPIEIGSRAERRPVVLFHSGRSPVRLGEDSAAWRWVKPKRQAVINYHEGGESDDE